MSNRLLCKGLATKTARFCLTTTALALVALLTSVAFGAPQWPKADSPYESTTKSLVTSEDSSVDDASVALEQAKVLLKQADEAYQQAEKSKDQNAKIERVDVAQGRLKEAKIVLDKLASDKDVKISEEYSKLCAKRLSLEQKCLEILAMYGLIAYSPPVDQFDDVFGEIEAEEIDVEDKVSPEEPSNEDPDADPSFERSLFASVHPSTYEIPDKPAELDEPTIAFPEGTQVDVVQIETIDSGASAESCLPPQPSVAQASPRGFRHYLRLIREVFYSPEREDTTCEERAGYDYSLCQDENKFEFVCRLLREQRETRPQAFWGFWALLLALIAFCFVRRCKRRAASGAKGEGDDASGQAKESEDSAKEKE